MLQMKNFRAFIYGKEADFRNNGPTRSLSLLDLLDQLDTEYTRINNLGRWSKPDDPQVLALMANFTSLRSNYSTLQKECASLRALLASKDQTQPPPTGSTNKPSKWKPGEPEVVELNGTTWKWCAKCFNGAWTKTHVTAEHVRGRGRQQTRQSPSNTYNNDTNANNTPQANLSTTSTTSSDPTYSQVLQSNISASNNFELDFM
jgi:hypothetical protein